MDFFVSLRELTNCEAPQRSHHRQHEWWDGALTRDETPASDSGGVDGRRDAPRIYTPSGYVRFAGAASDCLTAIMTGINRMLWDG